ncbi:MAG TPA: metal ABC transporter ATP-binding protein [Fusobacterium sp.]|uniref:metal ABC transporter ATP-binding protein n=1 Tax=Fusobacterium sp. TaxID=68766 RepID=UPI002F411233
MGKGIQIDIKNLNLILSNTEILKNINLTIQEGSIHCLVGPNGGGKTSLLRCILGQMPFEGEITFQYDEKEATGKNGEYTIGYVPQILDFERTLPITVEDFMCMTYQTKPCFLGSTREYRPIMEDLLKHLSMYDKRKRLLGNLSGGERQRVLLAQALYPLPNLLILDEPLTGIDKIGEEYFKTILYELKSKGVTILWIHHNLKQVKEMADFVTCIKQEIIFHGDPKVEIDEKRVLEIFA